MAIINCQQCGYDIPVTIENEGRVTRCPQCEKRIFVPLQQTTATATPAPIAAEIPSQQATRYPTEPTKKIVWSPKTRFSFSQNSANKQTGMDSEPVKPDYSSQRQSMTPVASPANYLVPRQSAPLPANYQRPQSVVSSASVQPNSLLPRQPFPASSSMQFSPPPVQQGRYSPDIEEKMKLMSPLGVLAEADALVVRQRVEHTEVWLGIEGKNAYDIYDQRGRKCYEAKEYELSWLSTILRIFLKSARPFSMEVTKLLGGQVLDLKRPFRFFFYKIDVYGPDNRPYGSVEKQFTLLRRKYLIHDPSGRPILEIIGPFFHPWTFNIYRNGKEVARISKKWSGLLKEAFTSADNFNLQFLQKDLAVEWRALLLGALILIDFVHFEYKG